MKIQIILLCLTLIGFTKSTIYCDENSVETIAATPEIAREIDERVDVALDFYKYSVLMDTLRLFLEQLEKAGVKFNSSYISPINNPEFIRVLLNQILKGKSNGQIKEWARENPDSHYVSGKREMELAFESGILRDCRTINQITFSILSPLTKNVELKKLVSPTTVQYHSIMRACELMIKGKEHGQLMNDLYQQFKLKYDKEHPNLFNFSRMFG